MSFILNLPWVLKFPSWSVTIAILIQLTLDLKKSQLKVVGYLAKWADHTTYGWDPHDPIVWLKQTKNVSTMMVQDEDNEKCFLTINVLLGSVISRRFW